MLEANKSPSRMGERHSGAYNTTDELDFLNDLPRLMSIRAGGKECPREQEDAQILNQYRKYLSSCNFRKGWGDIDKNVVQEHCRKIILRYAKRIHKRGYGL